MDVKAKALSYRNFFGSNSRQDMPRGPRTTQVDKEHVRLAAEFLVASELNRHKFHAAVQVGTNVRYDIAAFDDGGHIVYLEVKGTQEPGWILGEKAKSRRDQSVFYVLVSFGSVSLHERPEIFVIPSIEVSNLMRLRKRLDLGLNDFDNQKYRDAWHLLSLTPSERFQRTQ
jgi:hypothetical protein